MKMWVITNGHKIEERELAVPRFRYTNEWLEDARGVGFSPGKTAFETREEALNALRTKCVKAQAALVKAKRQLEKLQAALAAAEVSAQ